MSARADRAEPPPGARDRAHDVSAVSSPRVVTSDALPQSARPPKALMLKLHGAAAFVALIASGYAVYYLVDDASRASISSAHWLIGVALAPLLVMHIVIGRQCITKKEAARSSAR